MKNHSFVAMVMLHVTVGLAGVAGAASLTWDADTGTPGVQDGAGNWDTNTYANWHNGSIDVLWPNTTNDEAIIGGGAGGAGTIAVSTVLVNKLTFNAATTGNYTLSGGSITLAGSGITNTVNADATINSVLAGSAAWVKAGSGVLTLGGSNTFSQAVTILRGALRLTNNKALGSTGVTPATTVGDTTNTDARIELAGGVTISNETLTICGRASNHTAQIRSMNGTNMWDGAKITYKPGTGSDFHFDSVAGLLVVKYQQMNRSSLTAPITFRLEGAGDGIWVSGLLDPYAGVSVSVNKMGSGTWVLTNYNGYTGPTKVSDGVLSLGIIGSSTNVVNLGTGLEITTTANSNLVTLVVGSITNISIGQYVYNIGVPGGRTVASITDTNHFMLNDGAAVLDGTAQPVIFGEASSMGLAPPAAANLVFDGGTLQYTGVSDIMDRDFTINSGKTAILDITNATTELTITGASTATNGSMTKIGVGTLALTGTNRYTGATTVKNGTLSVNKIDASGGNSSLGNNSLAVTLGDVSTTGTLLYTGGSTSAARPFIVAAGGGRIGVASGTLTLTGAISGLGSLTKTGGGTLVLAATNTFAGATVVSDGILSLGLAGCLPTTTVLNLDGSGKMSNTVPQVVSSLYFDGKVQNRGTWGSPESSADNKSDRFLGSNVMWVLSGLDRGTLLMLR